VIEEELRSLLTERAEAVRDNPGRAVEVHTRIGVLRRRRVAGAALGLVLVVLAGLLVARFPRSNESLPPAAPVPSPPYFDTPGLMTVPGYSPLVLAAELHRALESYVPAQPGDFRYLVVVRCVRESELTFRHLAEGPRLTVRCSHRVGDHYEGAAAFDAEAARTLLAERSGDRGVASNVAFEPGADGQKAGLMMSNDPDRLRPWPDPGSQPLAEGTRTPDGTTVDITIPGYRGTRPDGSDALFLVAECVAGVRLDFSVPAGGLGTADCDPLAPNRMDRGRVMVRVTREELDRLGLRTGQRVPLTIRSVGRDTDQWRVFPPN
jgi:hypothetical protein